MKPTPTISEIEKKFDKRFQIKDYSNSIVAIPDTIKSFYRTQFTALLEELKGEEMEIPSQVSYPEYGKGFNQAIKEQNEKIERALK